MAALLGAGADGRAWLQDYAARLAGRDGQAPAVSEHRRQALMRRTNPVVIPRNHRVEAALTAAEAGDLEPVQRLLDVLQTPYRASPAAGPFTQPPAPFEQVLATFCGT